MPEGLGGEDPVVHFRDLGERAQPKRRSQAKGKDAEIWEGPDATDDLQNVHPDSSAFHGKDDLGEHDDRNKNRCAARGGFRERVPGR